MLLPYSVPAEPHAGDLSPFTIRIDLVSGRLELAGPLTSRTTHLLYDAVSTLLHADGDLWVVDAIGLAACDHSGLRAIGATYRRALRHGRRLLLIGASPALRQALTRLRLDHHVLAAAHRAGLPASAPTTVDGLLPDPARSIPHAAVGHLR